MHIFSTIADTLAQRLSKTPVRGRTPDIEDARRAMLALLPDGGGDLETERLRIRLLTATDVAGLWFLRVRLHQQLTRTLGEDLAMRRVRGLQHWFEPIVPAAWHRPATNRLSLASRRLLAAPAPAPPAFPECAAGLSSRGPCP